MKITILIAQKEGRFPNLKIKHTAVNTLKQANRVKRNIMDRKTYSLIRALEKNEKFVTEVKN